MLFGTPRYSWPQNLEFLRETSKNLPNVKLAHILEVFREVGVFSITFPRIPPSPSFSLLSRSFGTDQCASSEGFLVTFTPQGRKLGGFKFPFGYYPGFLFGGFIHIPLISGPPEPKLERKLGKPRSQGRPQVGNAVIHLNRNQRRILLVDLMNPGFPPLGVLVASKPTDETASAPVETSKKAEKERWKCDSEKF